MNALLVELRRSMEELQLGLDGALNMSEAMEALARGIAANAVPAAWMAAMSTRIQEVGGFGGRDAADSRGLCARRRTCGPAGSLRLCCGQTRTQV